MLRLQQNGYLALMVFAAGSYLASFACLVVAKLVSQGLSGFWQTF